MKKVIFFIIIILIAVFSYGFLAMANPLVLPEPKSEVLNINGEVSLIRNGKETEIEKGDELKMGDIIKTSDDGEIEINFFDNAVSRIGPNSNVELEDLLINKDNFSKTSVFIKVTVGRVWSRIIQLADQDASFEIGSNNTVATVKGTIVDFEVNNNGESLVKTIENIVEVKSIFNVEEVDEETGEKKTRKIVKKINLIQDFEIIISPEEDIEKIEEIKPQVMSSETKESKWFQENAKKDKEFDDYIKEKQEKIIEENIGVLPDSPLHKIKIISEKIKIATTKNQEEKQELKINFANKRLIEGQQLAFLGKSGIAQKTISNGEKQIEKIFEDNKDNKDLLKKMENKLRNSLDFQESYHKQVQDPQ